MKKYLFFLVLITLISSFSSTQAQSKYRRKHQPKFGLGVKAGLNYASQSTPGGSDVVDVESIIRMNGGIYCNYFLLDFLAIQPELMVSGKGVHWKDQYYNANDVLTYIDMPILIKYQPVSLFNIHAGPDFGYRISAVQKNLDNGQKTDIKDYYKPFDLGAAVGIEVNLPFRVNLTIRYVLGLIPATTDSQYDQPWKNNFFQISAGYRIFGK
jgi:Outer membrane protein beta-barrel domain